MKRIWEFTKFVAEKSAAFIGALTLAFVYWKHLRDFSAERDLKDLVQAALNVAAIGVGFLISSKAILLSISRSKVVREIQKSGHFVTLIGYFLGATWWSAFAAITSASLLWMDLSASNPSRQLPVLVWIFFCGGALGATVRVVHLFGKLVRASATEEAPLNS